MPSTFIPLWLCLCPCFILRCPSLLRLPYYSVFLLSSNELPPWEVLVHHLDWQQLLPQCSGTFSASVVAWTLSGLLLSEMLSLLRVGAVPVCVVHSTSPRPSTVPSTWEVLTQYLLNEWIRKLGLCCIQSIWKECFPLHFQSASQSWGSNSSTIYCRNPSLISNT